MDNQVNQSCSLVDFLLGDGIRPGWLDKQSHHAFANIEVSCPGYAGDQGRREVTECVVRGVWHGGGAQNAFGSGVQRFTTFEPATIERSMIGSNLRF
ncbi:hypothetical protein H7849_18945 [Alloacidobacterium dinghuense]|uniref:Uncharacterized protein n=1 Tax=Alloacidobacterium dinghuense TaxID=2763107 RepID=A0A7G8BF35_9BACT|nr:hypothetical protein [Alloacidobacterium dinghuense]QNI31155.1 hypothetical protein H7849_18945 [Alloacidobacterium dinghuense]